LEREPDMYMSELREALRLGRGIEVCVNTIKNTLKRRGLTYKKLTRPARERSEARRAAYLREISQYRPEMLVFLDESACN
ncbi:hypothetical protein L226DRAFT_425867, partial [Lentinus tigrinus ALCF2SS1-7]|uniref:uncharacterized protein n=1 Tax=Lentinus tigrinus ALCF2SS1-7 TaxID=1328758 RepID=UPI001166213E